MTEPAPGKTEDTKTATIIGAAGTAEGPPVAGMGDRRLAIYLDVDGVVTTSAYQRRAGVYKLDPSQIGIVAALVREYDARVVVSSTWRVDDCRQTLVEAGLPEGCFHPDWRTAIPARSRDPMTGAMLPADQAGRGAEIADHVGRNRISRYLVLDDVDVGPAHAGRHVRPDPERGLGDADAVLARGLLARMGVPRWRMPLSEVSSAAA